MLYSQATIGQFSDKELNDMMIHLIHGQHKLVKTGELPEGKPPFYDEEKFRAGQDFAQKYSGGIFFAHLLSLTFLLYPARVLKPLIYTKQSESPKKAYKRYMATACYVSCWYRCNLWENNSTARKSLQQVRSLHSHAALTHNGATKRSEVDRTCIADCGEMLVKVKPLYPIISEDLKQFDSCSFRSHLDDSYLYFDAPSASNSPFFNQVR